MMFGRDSPRKVWNFNMGRPVMLGNGSLTVGLNEHGLVHDFYYPYVGLDNLSTSRSLHHKIGVWVDGRFSWVDDGSWQIDVNFESTAMISEIRMQNDNLQIELTFNDFVDHEFNAFCRQITVINKSEDYRNIRLFMHQIFQISRAGRADTALFVPEDNYLIDYKGRCSLLIYGQAVDGAVFDQFAVGNFGIEGKDGTWRDAEDGELSGNAVEHGGVDSVLRFPCGLSGGSQIKLDYWIVAADSEFSAAKIHDQFRKEGLDYRIEGTRHYWKEWLAIAGNNLHAVDDEYQAMIRKSLMVIKVHTDKRGGVIASCDSSIYNFGRDYYSYVWPRDCAYVMWPLMRLGYTEEPKRFFEFCRDILTKDGYLMHKYQPDRAIGSTWHPLLHGKRKELAIQEDETAIVLYMLGEYLSLSGDQDFVFSLYNTFIQPAANFLATFLDDETKLPHASYDLWEEKFMTSTYTTAIVYQALLVASELAERFEYPDDAVRWQSIAQMLLKGSSAFFDEDRGLLRKGFVLQDNGSLTFDNTLDISSLYGSMMFGLSKINSPEIQQTVTQVENLLLDRTPSGGVPRYEYDHYFATDPPFLGNPWLITTLWMAQYYVLAGKPEKARYYINWVMKHALPSGVFSEQVNPSTGQPVSVTPLVWSHAEFINTVLDLCRLK